MKQLKDYINFYLGCKVALAGGESYTLKPSNLPNNWQSFSEPISGKLILRPLSDMTEDESNELWSHLEFNEGYSKERRKWFLETYLSEKYFEDTEDQITFKEATKIINWLRKNRFDCDGLIESGLAIDSTTLKTAKP